MNKRLLFLLLAISLILALASCKQKPAKPVVKAPVPEALHPNEKAARDELTLELTEFVKDACFKNGAEYFFLKTF